MPEQNPKIIYERNYLTNVICRIDFPEVLELNAENPPIELKKRIIEKFPLFETRKGQNVKVDIKEGSAVTDYHEEISWEFKNKDKSKIIIVNSKFLHVEYLKYKHIKEFLEDIRLVFGNLIGLYPIEITRRIGLRKINQIRLEERGNPYDWNDLIHPCLFSIPTRFTTNEDDVLRSMHILELEENDLHLRFQFGLFNSEFPNSIARKEFVLDYDCYTEDEIEISEVYNKIEEANDIIYRWFDKSIDNGLKDKMRGVEE
jgi:uncharacterized protein (TIGR04255 family)